MSPDNTVVAALNPLPVNPNEIFERSIRHFLLPILPLLDDPSISEIMINGPSQIYFERAGKLHLSECRFPDAGFVIAAARNIGQFVGRTVGDGAHSMDARLPDGSRVHVIVPPSSRNGPCISIRRFQKSTFSLTKLVERGSLTAEAAEFLRIAVLLHRNIIISGGTGTGKTSMLNALSAAIPESERIVVIEDTAELQLAQPHTVYLEAQPPDVHGENGVTIRDLFVDSLRMRPDRIVVGEVRRGEALDLVQSMLSGHAGSLATVHANTPRDAAVRLETLSMMNDVGLPAHVARTQVSSAVQIVLQLARMSDGSRKVTAVSECRGLSPKKQYRFRDLYRFVGRGRDETGKILGELQPTEFRPSFAGEIDAFGYRDEVRLTAKMFAPRSPI
jgi:pilus assembly protein CpaF